MAAGKQFFRRNPGGFQGKIAPSGGQKTRRLGMLTFFKQALADFSQNPLEYDLSEMMDDEEIREMARDADALRKELYESGGRNGTIM